MLKIGILGATGRMGKALIEVVLENPQTELSAAWEVESLGMNDVNAGSLVGMNSNVVIDSDLAKAVENSDVLIDFTRPQGTMEFLPEVLKRKKKMVIGTTGFDDNQLGKIREASKNIAIVHAPNFSVGVNLLLELLKKATKVLGETYDIEIVEAHHKHKVDAPSGTALRMGEVIAKEMGKDLKDVAVYERFGNTGERKSGTIGFATVRAGDIVGDHTAMFATEGERVEITHKASSRRTFAGGAVRAALWLDSKQSGLYDMSDVLDFK